jgi:hypothetical protein
MAEKGSKVKDRLLNEGVQAGLGHENLSGYKNDMDAKASRNDNSDDAPPAAEYKYPIEGRLTDATGVEIKLSEYKEVKPNDKWQTGELGGLSSKS